MIYDYIIVGSGLFGSVFACEMHKAGKKVLVLEKKNHVGGQVYTKRVNGIEVHVYGPHIFHTSNKEVWDYIQQFADFNHFINSPLAYYKGKMYALPFNMNTFHQLWGVTKPEDAEKIIQQQREMYYREHPKNLEEQAINLVGYEIYEKLIKGYTEKQWGRSCDQLPPSIIKRLPIRFTFNNNYFNDIYQGIPIGGYTQMVEKMLEGIAVRTNTDFFDHQSWCESNGKKIVYTGPIDVFYRYEEGILAYRSLRFEHEEMQTKNFQGNAVINYTEKDVPYTRIIEHKHFDFGQQSSTVISKEYPMEWDVNQDAYYPINDEKNSAVYLKYKEKADQETKYIFGGRLAEYKYYDMHQVIESALKLVSKELKQ